MKVLATSFVAALILAATGTAQTTSSSATQIGTMTVSTSFPSTTNTDPASTKPKGTRTTNEIFVWRTSDGQVKFTMKVGSIKVEDYDGTVNTLTTEQILDALSKATVAAGYERGLTNCSDVYTDTDPSEVWSESRVGRTGTGSSTQFFPYDAYTYGARTYSVHCEQSSTTGGVAVIAEPSSTSDSPSTVTSSQIQ